MTAGIGNRYVATKDIRAALRGRETDILDALGIRWRDGRPCPFPSHTDVHPSWRFDERTGRVICSCGSYSILDVMIKVEGIDFDAGKIRAAEILGRQDLIRVRARIKHYQRHDANSLLNPPSDIRDDEVPFIYLGARLGIEPADVPRPATPVAGIESLEYFDPPASPRAKPKLLGSWPCAVFGTVAADGRRHAHRIYLSPDGRAKADLGIGPDGEPRDPRKSAKLADGQVGTAGCAVIWGDPQKARHLVLFEGIENAAVGAYALRPEIEAGEIYVASAINAGGVEAFAPYPATELATVGADRDEAKEGAGYQRGERAARTFALRNHNRVVVRTALPGEPGKSVDWLDILQGDGVEAVRVGMLGAAPFEPTQDEIEEQHRTRHLSDEISQVAETYPLPHLQTMLLAYRHTDDGRVWVHKYEGVGKDGTPRWTPISSPFGVPARLRQADHGNAYGLRCFVQDMGGRPRTVDFYRDSLARMAASEIRAALFAAGLRTEVNGDMIAVDSLKAADPTREIIIVSRPGWHEIPGLPDLVFICPNGEVIGAPDGLALELAASERMAPDVAVAGTIEGWRHAIEAALLSGCPHWVVGIAAGFVGPLVSLIGLDTCGVNLSGLSSSGKSTGQRFAVAAWSTPDLRRPGLSQSARATDNAVEALAHRATGTVLSLDELAHLSGKAAAQLIYTIAGGVGKRRMTADALLRDSYSWSTFAVLSAECSLEEKIRADGGEWRAGMAVRIVDIDVVGVNRNVGRETFLQINQIEQHHGHGGPAFVHSMISLGLHRQAVALRKRITDAAQMIAGEGADSAKGRAAIPFALLLIAGELAKGFGIIPGRAPVKEAVIWAWERFQQSSDSLALDPEVQFIANLRRWIAERWDVLIKSTKATGGINNRETIAWYDETAVYIPKDTIREAAGNVLKESHIGAMLDKRGFLAQRTETDRFCVRWVPQVGKVTSYALRRSEFGRTDTVVDPEAFTVHQGGVDA